MGQVGISIKYRATSNLKTTPSPSAQTRIFFFSLSVCVCLSLLSLSLFFTTKTPLPSAHTPFSLGHQTERTALRRVASKNHHCQVLQKRKELGVQCLPTCKHETRDVEGSCRGQNFPGNSDLDFAEETKNLEFHGKSPNFRKVPMNEFFFF